MPDHWTPWGGMPLPKPGLMCPSTMCPLIAKDGSPWDGRKAVICPGKGGLPSDGDPDCCPWWDMGCGGNGHVASVDAAEQDMGRAVVVGPNMPRRSGIGSGRTYDCPHAPSCRWQEQSPTGLCAPREALKRGMDPRVCCF